MSRATRGYMLESDRSGRERSAAVCLWVVAGSVSAAFAWIVGDLLWHGLARVDIGFLIEPPRRAGRAGGVAPMLVSTLLVLSVSLVVAIPLGMGSAIWLAEFTRRGGSMAAFVGRSLDVLAAVPSIVFGLFGNAFFCNLLGLGYSILAGGLTLACMVLPILIRSLEAGLRAVPDDYRLAAQALGISRTRAVVAILLPSAVPALVVGVVLGMGRAMAETAALLFTSGYVDRMPRGLMDSGRTLSIHIYDLSMNVAGGEPNAYATAVVLVGLLMIANWGAVWTADRWLRRRETAG